MLFPKATTALYSFSFFSSFIFTSISFLFWRRFLRFAFVSSIYFTTASNCSSRVIFSAFFRPLAITTLRNLFFLYLTTNYRKLLSFIKDSHISSVFPVNHLAVRFCRWFCATSYFLWYPSIMATSNSCLKLASIGCAISSLSFFEEFRRLRNATSRINTAFFVTYKQITPHRIWYNRVD